MAAGFLHGKGMLRKELLGSIPYFDILVHLTTLALVGTCLTRAVAHRPGWIRHGKDVLGLGLLLGAMLAFILLRRRVSAHSILWVTCRYGCVDSRCWGSTLQALGWYVAGCRGNAAALCSVSTVEVRIRRVCGEVCLRGLAGC